MAMNISRRTKIAALVVLLVLVSLATGFILGAVAAKKVAKRKDNPRFWKQVAMRQLEKLDPTDDQRRVFEGRVDEAVKELMAIRKDTVARAEEVVAKAVVDIAGELTPEQREAFDKIKPKPKLPEAE